MGARAQAGQDGLLRPGGGWFTDRIPGAGNCSVTDFRFGTRATLLILSSCHTVPFAQLGVMGANI